MTCWPLRRLLWRPRLEEGRGAALTIALHRLAEGIWERHPRFRCRHNRGQVLRRVPTGCSFNRPARLDLPSFLISMCQLTGMFTFIAPHRLGGSSCAIGVARSSHSDFGACGRQSLARRSNLVERSRSIDACPCGTLDPLGDGLGRNIELERGICQATMITLATMASRSGGVRAASLCVPINSSILQEWAKASLGPLPRSRPVGQPTESSH
ncbi:hypothetical protein ABIA06_003467 [Bradyrhizobium yuanmingense]